MSITISGSGITSANIADGTIVNADINSSAAIAASKLSGVASTALDSPSVTGTLFVDDGSTVSHTISNWSDDITYVITPTNCTVGSVNSSGVFVVTHTSGTPSYTIKATTDSLGLADSSVVTKNIGFNLSAPTLSSPADVATATDVVYTITSTDSGDDKIILDIGSSNFTYSSVSVGTASKVGNTVECIGFTTNNPAVTIQFTAEATYSVTAKSVNIAGTYGDSASSSADSITIADQTYSVDFLVIAGGGSGGSKGNSGGGGAGGYRTSTEGTVNGGTVITVTVGDGGPSTSNTTGTTGSASSFSGSGLTTISSAGGGGGGHSVSVAGLAGGSGGGGGNGTSGGAGNTPSTSPVQGYAGGTGYHGVSAWGGGGGGGSSQVGYNGSSAQGGNGGNGTASSITGAAVTRAGGGGGGTDTTIGSGGTGGGGDASNGGNGVSGTANTGSGGGACEDANNSGAGGKGVVILSVPDANYSGTTTGSPTVATDAGGTGKTVLTFTGTGSYTA